MLEFRVISMEEELRKPAKNDGDIDRRNTSESTPSKLMKKEIFLYNQQTAPPAGNSPFRAI